MLQFFIQYVLHNLAQKIFIPFILFMINENFFYMHELLNIYKKL